MKQLAFKLTEYFDDVQGRLNLQDYDFSSSKPFVSVPLDTLRSGALSAQQIKQLFDAAKKERKTKSDAKSIEVIVALVSMRYPRGSKVTGLLLLPATLERDGKLTADLESNPPWVPASRLSTEGADPDGTIGSLSDYWRYQREDWPEVVSHVQTWEQAVDAGFKMFDAVATDLKNVFKPHGGPELLRQAAYVSAGDRIIANGPVRELYGFLIDENPEVATYGRLLSFREGQRRSEDGIDKDISTLLRTSCASCGSMTDGFPLTASQRAAVHAYLEDSDGDVTAVSGPPGTGKTTMLQSVVASTIVRHCMFKRRAPLIVGTSTNNQAVTNIIDSFSSVTKAEPGPLDQRWLLRASKELGEGPTEEPLVALAAYCPASSRKADADKANYLTEDREKSGVYSEYSTKEYVAGARTHFFEQLNRYLRFTGVKTKPDTLKYAEQLLRALLLIIDKNRVALLEKAAQQEKQAPWEFGRAFQQKAATEINELVRFGALNTEHKAKLDEAESLLDVDKVLDTSARYVEFWLAVHYYEAQWLRIVSSQDLIAPDDRRKNTAGIMEKYWKQVAAVTPCFVMTAFQLPKYFSIWKRGLQDGQSLFDLERADLLIMDESGQVDTSLGASAFALAKRALVVGDTQQLAPVWGIDPVSDEEVASSNGLGPDWKKMERVGLTASQPSSVMAAAASASNWCYGREDLPGLFLSEHFRCHKDIINYCNELLYKGMLVPSRPTGGYKLAEMFEGKETPFLFYEVEGSKDQKSGSSRVNHREAEEIAKWITENYDRFAKIYDKDGKHPGDVVGVVTPFAAQARLISRKLRDQGGQALAGNITVGTAHRLQGAERPVVLFSSVYGDNSGTAPFVDNTLELMNVAVSRAKDLFIVFGGNTRWEDKGPVFGLVSQVAKPYEDVFSPGEESADFGAQPPGSGPAEAQPAKLRHVDRNTSGYLNATELGKTLSPARPARDLNAALKASGILEQGTVRFEGESLSSTWMPTALGREIGIAVTSGGTQGNRYVFPLFSPEAIQTISDWVQAGKISFD